MDDSEFINHFRVSREAFTYITDTLSQFIFTEDTQFRKAIPVETKVAVALKLLAGNCDYRTISSLFGVGKSTVHSCIKLFLEHAEHSLVCKHIRWPGSSDYCWKVSEGFKRMWQFPMVLGVVDVCHIPVKGPLISDLQLDSDFLNEKGWASIAVLVVSDAKGCAIYAKAGFPGKTTDMSALTASDLYAKMQAGTRLPSHTKNIGGIQVPFLLLGDDGFPLKPWLLKPYPYMENMPEHEVIFNYRHARAHKVVENLLSRWKGRWRRFQKTVELKLQDIPKLVSVTLALHNICEEFNVPCDHAWLTEAEHADDKFPQPVQFLISHDSDKALKIRNSLAHQFLEDVNA